MSDTYAGDITPKQAWEMLSENPDAVLIDVRTAAEWAWVGQVDLSGINKQHQCVEWNRFPGGVPNENFIHEIAELNSDKGTPLLFLCRSGVRSKYAAIAMTQAGFAICYNISGGFEGDPNDERHRASVNGWKFDGLPWIQG